MAAMARLAVPAQITAASNSALAASVVTRTRPFSGFKAVMAWPYRQATPRRAQASARPVVNLWISPVESLSV